MYILHVHEYYLDNTVTNPSATHHAGGS